MGKRGGQWRRKEHGKGARAREGEEFTEGGRGRERGDGQFNCICFALESKSFSILDCRLLYLRLTDLICVAFAIIFIRSV